MPHLTWTCLWLILHHSGSFPCVFLMLSCIFVQEPFPSDWNLVVLLIFYDQIPVDWQWSSVFLFIFAEEDIQWESETDLLNLPGTCGRCCGNHYTLEELLSLLTFLIAIFWEKLKSTFDLQHIFITWHPLSNCAKYTKKLPQNDLSGKIPNVLSLH